MGSKVITGFHAIEEKIRRFSESGEGKAISLKVSKTGPRVKKILEAAKSAGIPFESVDSKTLDSLVQSLPQTARDHRGIVLEMESDGKKGGNSVEFDIWLREKQDGEETLTVLILDSITDPHNVGAILRSCDQFGVSLAVLPSRRGAGDILENETVARSSAGASAHVPVAVVTNLVRSVQLLKEAGFWVYGADAGGKSVQKVEFAQKSAIVMGSEGNGIAKLLEEQCDQIVSIPTCGKIDSLNVSVAAGILLYERHRQSLLEN